MRRAFCDGMVSQSECQNLIFLTGDLGFRALEPLRDALGTRFLNAGVAEQNMVSVAAGLARKGFRSWCYSIAPFLYARTFEQIRNDICLHKLPAVLVGNGGGYGYGVMGGTHHALEDYGLMLTLPFMDVYIPSFDEDLAVMIPALMTSNRASYLRLGLSELPKGFDSPKYSPWRRLTRGDGGTLIAVGPLAGAYWAACAEMPEKSRPNLWCLSQLPVPELPGELLDAIRPESKLVIAEEHVAQGSAGQSLAMTLLQASKMPSKVRHLTAVGYPSARYGSQKFHRAECRLDPASVLSEFLNEPS